MPPIRRDLSVAVDADDAGEDLGDRGRYALDEDADPVEDVAVARRDRLPPAPRPGHRSTRHPARAEERAGPGRVAPPGANPHRQANRLRDRVYAALQQGTRHAWAAATSGATPRRLT